MFPTLTLLKVCLWLYQFGIQRKGNRYLEYCALCINFLKILKPSRPCGGSWVWKSFCVPYSVFVGNRSSLHDLPWLPKCRFKHLLIREGRECRDKAGTAKKQACSPVLVLPQEIHITVSWGAGLVLTLILSATPLLNYYNKRPHQVLPGWDTQFSRAGSHCVPPTPCKAVRLLFSTSLNTQSLKFDSASVHRGWVFWHQYYYIFFIFRKK